MGIKILNEYRVTFDDNTDTAFMAENARSAVRTLETDAKQVVQLSRVKTGVGVQTPIRNVKFTVAVLPEAAAVNKCKAVPDTWVVPEGTEVIFTALPADGYQFDGWFAENGTTPLSEDAVAELEVNYPADPAALSAKFEAHFSVIK